MSRKLFLNILQGVRDYDSYFRCKPNVTGRLRFTSYQKCSATVCMLAYEIAGYLIDEYLRMRETI
jgi:hypothetical protein